MPGAKGGSNGLSNVGFELRRKFVTRAHLDEQEDTFIFVLRTALTDAKRIVNDACESFHNGVYLGRSEPYSTWIQDTVTGAGDLYMSE